MDRTIYISTSSMMTQDKILNDISNNMVNANTPGYKKDITYISPFTNELLKKIDTNETFGNLKNEVVLNNEKTVFNKGSLITTNDSLNFAINGDGFFKTEKNGNYYYTRNGSFSIDGSGYLSTQDGAYVLDKNGERIKKDQKDLIDNIAVVDFMNKNNLEKIGNGDFISHGEPEVKANYTLADKCLEGSNVDLSKEMTNLISTKNIYTLSEKAIQTSDELLEKICNLV